MEVKDHLKKVNVYLIGAVAAIAGLLFGFDTGVISGAQGFMFETFGIGEGDEFSLLKGFVVASVPLGALAGAMMSGGIAGRIGRRKGIMLTAVLFLIGTVAASFADELTHVILGRLFMGLAIGISAMIAPMYLGEISPPKIRGTIIFLFQLAITLGLLSAFAVNCWFSKEMYDPSMNWRFMFGVGLIPATLLLVGMYYMPYSPRWLFLRGRLDEARHAMRKLLGKANVDQEMAEIEESVLREGNGLKELFKKPIFGLLAVAFGLFVFQQLSGINAIMYYGPAVFEKAGFGETAKFDAQFYMGLTNVLATVFGVWVVDKIGRRSLLFVGFLGMIVCLGLMSYFLKVEGYAQETLWSVLIYVVCFAISLGGVPYIIMSEVFPLRVRASGMAVASCANWGFNWLVSSSFPFLVSSMGSMGDVFALYCGCTVVGLLFAWKFVPETKGCALETIESNLYEGKRLRAIGVSK